VKPSRTIADLIKRLESLPLKDLERANKGSFEISDLLNLITRPVDYTVDQPYSVEESVVKKQKIDSEDFWKGKESLSSGETLFCIIVDDHTRPGHDIRSILETHLVRSSWIKHVYVLTDPKITKDVESCILNTGSRAKILQQRESLGLTPSNELFVEDEKPAFYPCGSGDLIDQIECLDPEVKYVHFCNGLSDGVDPSLVGMHINSNFPVTWKVSKRNNNQDRGILCEHEGFPQIVEKFRITSSPEEIFEFNSSDTCVFNRDLEFTSVRWKWHRRKIQSGNSLMIQYKRTLYDLTAAFKTQFVRKDEFDDPT
jgi:hypothetical protein